jgi:hypothetical protein
MCTPCGHNKAQQAQLSVCTDALTLQLNGRMDVQNGLAALEKQSVALMTKIDVRREWWKAACFYPGPR